jgi:predicted 3-demethylubiquinone-9 3-methyltransferase (glyoxalase superfamily)
MTTKSGRAGDVLTVECTVAGVPCIGLTFRHNEAFSFQIATDDQDETDRYWNAILGNGGQERQCGWCKDKRVFRGKLYQSSLNLTRDRGFPWCRSL